MQHDKPQTPAEGRPEMATLMAPTQWVTGLAEIEGTIFNDRAVHILIILHQSGRVSFSQL